MILNMTCSEVSTSLSEVAQYQIYKTPQVRALVWSLISPPLSIRSDDYPASVSSQWCEQIYQRIKTPLQQLDSNPEPLILWLKQYHSWRLGIRFEAYWAYILELLKQQGEIITYASHIQIDDPIKQTRGELDFVYLDKQKQFWHLEIAVKFYLLKPDEFGYERLTGPNGQDWYERKLIHLFKKQLPLSRTEDARQILAQSAALNEYLLNDAIYCQPQGLIKGMIFFPVTGEGALNVHEQNGINPECETGLWATQDNWYLSDPGQLGRWVIMDKLNWLVPQVYASIDNELYSFKEMDYKIKIHFHATKRSLFVARLEYDELQKLWLEQQRIMIVDRYWPSYRKTGDKSKTIPSN